MKISDYGYSIAVRISSNPQKYANYVMPRTEHEFFSIVNTYSYWTVVLRHHGGPISEPIYYGLPAYRELMAAHRHHRQLIALTQPKRMSLDRYIY